MKTSPRSLLGLLLPVLAVGGLQQWWAARAQQRLGEQVARLAKVGDIRMLPSDSCGVCAVARAWFTEHQGLYAVSCGT